jgi:hypothetical protein
MPTLHRAQAVDKCQGLAPRLNAVFELRVSNLFQEMGEAWAGRKAVLN